MRFRALLFALIASFGPLSLSSEAHADAAARDGWSVFELRDGTVSAEMPCDEGEIGTMNHAGNDVLLCRHDGLLFLISVGDMSTADLKSPHAKSFDANYSEAMADTESGVVTLGGFGELQSFVVAGEPDGIINRSAFVDLGFGTSLFALVVERPQGNALVEPRSESWDRAAAFLESIKVSS